VLVLVFQRHWAEPILGFKSDGAFRHGITVTAAVLTSAALVMVAVFSIFGTLSSLEIEQAGVGLAAAVLIDATIVRAVLLPSSMKLLGEWNWYLPRTLRRLPRLGRPRSQVVVPPAREPVWAASRNESPGVRSSP
jgi:putative drug exporter of the RND superfamily